MTMNNPRIYTEILVQMVHSHLGRIRTQLGNIVQETADQSKAYGFSLEERERLIKASRAVAHLQQECFAAERAFKEVIDHA